MQDFGEQEVPPFVQRMIDEYAQLKERCEKLAAFMMDPSPIYEKLPDPDKNLLNAQHRAMCEYKVILTRRIERALGGKL